MLIQIQEHISLRTLNTFGMPAIARHFTLLTDPVCLPELAAYPQRHVLGGGSNVLLTGPVEGLLIANRLKGIKIVDENEAHVWLEVASGEIWHDLVLYTIGQGWSGLENLALIPGTAGAAPIQNIGAYGVEVKDLLHSVQGFEWAGQRQIDLPASDCAFGYRDSIFKQDYKDKLLITSIVLKLNKQFKPQTTYGAIADELRLAGVTEAGASDVAQAVIRIRSSKLPDPKQIGNAGSFFKNPVVPAAVLQGLQTRYPSLPFYPQSGDLVKIPAGWLIEQAGWKGFREGDAGVHARQALVLVNYGTATGAEIWALSDRIVKDIYERFGISLEREVQVW